MDLTKFKNTEKTLLDVRSPEEFSQNHVPGAVNIPLDQITNRLDEIESMKSPIIAYCRSGNRSEMATSILKQHGYEAYNGGGLSDVLQQIN